MPSVAIGYVAAFQRRMLVIPTGTRAVASAFNGAICPTSINMGKVQGPSPGTCSVTITTAVPAISLGTITTVQIGGAFFTGIVVLVQQDTDARQGTAYDIKLVDCRDRLYDFNIFAQFNMLDDEGRWYHIFPGNDWQVQRRTYFSTATSQSLDNADTIDGAFPENDCIDNLITAAGILNGLAQLYGFNVVASSYALQVLQSVVPDNLDWNSGVHIGDAIAQVLDMYDLQMTAWGNLNLYISMRGVMDNPLTASLFGANICGMLNCVEGSFGQELNERGRSVVIVGDQDEYEATYGCRPGWNEKFTADEVFGRKRLSDLMLAVNFTDQTRMEDFWNVYQDWMHDDYWDEKWIGDMTIAEYIETFPFKVYNVDFGFLLDLKNTTKVLKVMDGAYGSSFVHVGDDYPFFEDFYLSTSNGGPNPSEYPITDQLITNTNVRCVVRSSSDIQMNLKGQKQPLAQADPINGRVIIADGVDLEVQQVAQQEDCRDRFSVRVIFNERQFKADPAQLANGIQVLLPSDVTCKLSRQLTKFVYRAGDGSGAPRVRELTRYVAGCRRGFLFLVVGEDDDHNPVHGWQEVPMLAGNYGTTAPLTATECAATLAAQMLYHEVITSAGYMKFKYQGGLSPDGLIDNVLTTFSAESGIEETANFTTEINDLNVGYQFRQPGRITKISLLKLRDPQNFKKLLGAVDKKLKRARALHKTNKPQKGRGAGDRAKIANAFAADNSVLARAGKDFMQQAGSVQQYQLVAFRNPNGGTNQTS